MIQVYTGNGKGKTSAALGLAIRAAGAGLKVYIAQFAKGRKCSELSALKKIKNIKVEQFGTCFFLEPAQTKTQGFHGSPRSIKKISNNDKRNAQAGIKRVRQILKTGRFNVLILDEINIALNLGLVGLDSVLKLIKRCPHDSEIVLTGRSAPPGLLEIADLVSEIKEIKHYYKKGILARKGIEF